MASCAMVARAVLPTRRSLSTVPLAGRPLSSTAPVAHVSDTAVVDGLVVSRSPCGEVLHVTLDRPKKHNALSSAVVDGLLATVRAASCDDSATRLLVLRGNGKSLCAGFDIEGIEDQSDADVALRFLRLEMLLASLHHAPFASLALIQGACFGAGADLAAACSSRVAAPEAKFRMPGLLFEVVLGTRRLADQVGTSAARRLLESCKVFDVEEAMVTGFVTQVAKEADWDAIAADAAAAARALPRSAQRALLERTRRSDSRDADLAALARSVAAPGLKDRIVEFRRQQQTQRDKARSKREKLKS